MNRRPLVLSLLISLPAGCRTAEREPESRVMPATTVPTVASPPPAISPSPKEAKTLFELPRSAYSAQLHVDAGTLHVVTPSELASWRSGKLTRKPFDFGSALTPRHDEVIFVRDGALRRQAFGAKSDELLARSILTPERIVATDSAVFTLERTSEGRSRVSIVAHGKSKKLYETTALVATLSARDEKAFFVETSGDGYRIGSVASGGETSFGPTHEGRTPAALNVSDALYYYDGPRGELRRTSLDLERESVVANDVVCSPLGVAKKAYCAFPGSVTEINLDGGSKKDLELHARGPITALTIFENELLWLEDAGAERLVVRSLPL